MVKKPFEKFSPLVMLLITLAVVGTVMAAGIAIVIFESPHSGKYSGPGLPTEKSVTFTIPGGNNSYFAQPVKINSTNQFWFNVSEYSANSDTGFEWGLMNSSEYANLTNNVSITFLDAAGTYTGGNVNTLLSYQGQGEQTIYVVWINTGNTAYSASWSITVTVTQ
ncbi:MAG: hypothetical protein M1507_05570 [Candidatus Thermoplasmatota archaeon]|nr:hypothetical protein [Candidatus Thermoplasmatota archaeon]